MNEESKEDKTCFSYEPDEDNPPPLTWDDILWLKSVTKLPIILKGILHHRFKHFANILVCKNVFQLMFEVII